jgi:hypothetical protein
MAVEYANRASSVLAASINSSQTTFDVQVGHGLRFPAAAGLDHFYVTLDNNNGTIEIVKVTGRAADTFTVERGQDGTAASAFTAGDAVELRITKALLDDFKSDARANLAPLSGTGVVSAAYGGSGRTFLEPNNVLLGNGTGAVQQVAAGTAGNVLTSNGSTWASAAPPSTGSANVQNFEAVGTTTWTKPAGAKMVHVIIFGGGGGGGSGRRRSVTTTAATGGAGGGPGGRTELWLDASLLAATETVAVGAGGSGGASRTTDATDGQAGGDGGFSQFSSYYARGGFGGGSGATTTASSGSSGTQAPSAVFGNALSYGVAGNGTTNTASAGGRGGLGPGAGGGATGFAASSTAASNGGAGGAGGDAALFSTASSASGGGGTAASSVLNAGDGASRSIGLGLGGSGGGGGASHAGRQTGGDGGSPGGGGGGGAASESGVVSGAGGAGGRGSVRVVTYL